LNLKQLFRGVQGRFRSILELVALEGSEKHESPELWVSNNSGVRSVKEKWERNGKGIHEDYIQREREGNRESYYEKKCRRQPAKKKSRSASESEKVFARILDEF